MSQRRGTEENPFREMAESDEPVVTIFTGADLAI